MNEFSLSWIDLVIIIFLHTGHHLVWDQQGKTTKFRRIFFSRTRHDLAHRWDFPLRRQHRK